MTHDDLDNFIINRLRMTIVTSNDPATFVSVKGLAKLFGVTPARLLDCALDAHLTDTPDGKLQGKLRWAIV